jgi:hypothetical protein
MAFYIEDYETAVSQRKYEAAAQLMLQILHGVDGAYGTFENVLTAYHVENYAGLRPEVQLATRFAAATSTLMADPDFNFNQEGFQRAIVYQRWLAAIFSITPFRNADHIMRLMDVRDDRSVQDLSVPINKLYKFTLLYFPMSRIPLDMDALWAVDPGMAASLGIALLSPRFNGDAVAYSRREWMLPWLAEKLPQVEGMQALPAGVMHDAYMHCSYAAREDRHDIKRAINVLARRQMEAWNLKPVERVPQIKKGHKPVLLVVVEYFTGGHSIYRTHSRAIEGAKEKFHVIGMGYEGQVDGLGRAIFDEFIPISGDGLDAHLRCVRDVAVAREIDVFYMPSVGMFQLTMYLTNLRLAPVQAVALGHPATTHSDATDWVVVEDDYVGGEKCFSEGLMRLPKDGMPYRPSEQASSRPLTPPLELDRSKVHVVVAATPMKLNPAFIEACQLIEKGATEPVHFHFLVGSSRGIVHEQAQQWVENQLADHVSFYPHQNYHEYLRVIQSCDLFINPFPFGNTNGIVDCVTAGLIGVCKTGPEVFEHIDEAMFKRMGFPEALIAESTAAYIHKAVMLIDNKTYRDRLRLELSGPDAVQVLFRGRPDIMGQMFLQQLEKLSKPAHSHKQ